MRGVCLVRTSTPPGQGLVMFTTASLCLDGVSLLQRQDSGHTESELSTYHQTPALAKPWMEWNTAQALPSSRLQIYQERRGAWAMAKQGARSCLSEEGGISGGPVAKTPHPNAGGSGSILVGELDPTWLNWELTLQLKTPHAPTKTSSMLRLGSAQPNKHNNFLKSFSEEAIYKKGNLRFPSGVFLSWRKQVRQVSGHPALKAQGSGSTQMFLIMTELGICPASVLLFGRQEQMNGMRRMDMSKCCLQSNCWRSLRWRLKLFISVKNFTEFFPD